MTEKDDKDKEPQVAIIKGIKLPDDLPQRPKDCDFDEKKYERRKGDDDEGE
jgi:hypothetical protein